MIPWIPGGGTYPARTLTDLLTELYPALNAEDSATLIWWTQAELIEWANEAVKDLARRWAVFVERDVATSTVAGTASYSLPTRHISTLYISLGGLGLRPVNVRELESYSYTWSTDACAGAETPFCYLQDEEGAANVRLYKTPNAVAVIGVVHRQYLADLTAGSTMGMPDPVTDWVYLKILGEARMKEGDGGMPEVGAFCETLRQVYERAFESYWGVSV